MNDSFENRTFYKLSCSFKSISNRLSLIILDSMELVQLWPSLENVQNGVYLKDKVIRGSISKMKIAFLPS